MRLHCLSLLLALITFPIILKSQSVTGAGRISGGGTVTNVVFTNGGGSFPPGWTSLPNTNYAPICPNASGARPDVQGNSGCPYVMNAWSGGFADLKRNRLIFWGGGHHDYYGNEVYAFDPVAGTIKTLDKATDVTGINTNTTTYESYSDGTAGARHTYGGISYNPTTDLMVIEGGGLASPSDLGREVWTLNFPNLSAASTGTCCWTHLNPTKTGGPGNFSTNFGNLLEYDPNTDRMWLWEANTASQGNLWEANDTSMTGFTNKAQYGNTGIPFMSGNQSGTIDPSRQIFWAIGLGKILRVSIASGSTFVVSDDFPTSTNCGTADISAGYPGVAFDYSDKNIVIYRGQGNTVTVYNPASKTCTTETYASGPGNQDAGNNGIFGRFRYIPTLGVFVECNSAFNNCFVLARNVDFPMNNSWNNILAGINVPGGSSSVVSSQSFETTIPSCGPPFPCDSYAQGRQDYLHKTEADSPVPDCTVSADGSCSIHFVINAGSFQGNSGSYYHTFNATQTALYGQNSEFYVQFKQRLGPEFMQPGEFTGPFTGFKTDIIGEGDSPTQKANDCADTPTDIVIESSLDQSYPWLYVNCGSTSGVQYFLASNFFNIQTQAFNLPGGSNFLDQNAAGCPHYFDGTHTTPRTDPTCFNYVGNEWMTIQQHIKVGTWATASSVIETWYAHTNQPSRLIVNAADAGLNDLGGSFTDKFGRLILLPYATAVNWVNATNAWYDDVIISNRRVPDPNTNVPNAPDSLSLSGISTSSITVNWRVNSFNITPQDDSGFLVERCTGDYPTCLSNPQTGFSTIATTAPHTTTFTDSTVSAGHVYTYRVRAKGIYGNSAYATSICFNLALPSSGSSVCGTASI